MDRYSKANLKNVITGTVVEQVDPAKYARDAYYEQITVHIFARMIDDVEDSAGRLKSGSKTEYRRFSEYWTFIATIGADLTRPISTTSCVSCGAPLQINENAQCDHCGAHLASGQFGWVLSRIEQDEAYFG
jgi:hypothetical protein